MREGLNIFQPERGQCVLPSGEMPAIPPLHPLPFDRHGESIPLSPVVLSVPHAGRDYPPDLLAALRVPAAALIVLEDRHVDTVARAAWGEETLFVQRRARAWIDLNRSEQERDPAIDEGARATALPVASAKVRSGLGLVPRRVAGAGELWRRRFSASEMLERIVDDHRPYHAALADALRAARQRFGVAVLLDIHSMPSLGPGAPRIVLGDRYGRSADSRFINAIERVARAADVPVARNTPYAGAHILETHASGGAIHAIQLEFDRTLYLDPAGDLPGDGLAPTAGILRAMIDALAHEALRWRGPTAVAAE